MILTRNTFSVAIALVAIVATEGMLATSARADIKWRGVPVDPSAPLAFEDSANWQAANFPGTPPTVPPPGVLETVPPGDQGTWFFRSDNAALTGKDILVSLNDARDGTGGSLKLGAGAIGYGSAGEVQTLLINNNVTITGDEFVWPNGVLNASGARRFRVGLKLASDFDPGVNQFSWGVVKQTTGTVFGEYISPDGGTDNVASATLKLSSDGNSSQYVAGSVYEVGGDASLHFRNELNHGSGSGKAENSIFRVRGSNVGEVRFEGTTRVTSQTALWDVSQVMIGGFEKDQINRGRSITEFVLDQGGVTPIQTDGQLQIGSEQFSIDVFRNVRLLAFMRVKLSEPTAAGTDPYDSDGTNPSDDNVVLFQAEYRSSTMSGTGSGELDNGAFFDPDRSSATAPHRPMFNVGSGAGTVISDYAGATYTWNINYGGTFADATIDDVVVLSDLVVTGTPGDYDADGLDAKDIDQITAAFGTPIGLDAAQNPFDINGDGVVDNLDSLQWVTHAGFANTQLGDVDLDGDVDAADLATMQSNFGSLVAGWALGDTDGDQDVDGADYLNWQRNFTGSITSVSTTVPEPMGMVLFALGGLTLLATDSRRGSRNGISY